MTSKKRRYSLLGKYCRLFNAMATSEEKHVTEWTKIYSVEDVLKEMIRKHDVNQVLDNAKQLSARGTWKNRIKDNNEGGKGAWQTYERQNPRSERSCNGKSRDGHCKSLPRSWGLTA
jgi:hypothetical protein